MVYQAQTAAPVHALSDIDLEIREGLVNWMPDALAAREAGVPLVKIAQVFNQSGLMLTCKKSSGVASPKDFKGKTLVVWYGGNEHTHVVWDAAAK